MTKHEAVEILEEVKTLDDSMFAYSQAYNDALDMAIEALKAQEPRVMTRDELDALARDESDNVPVWYEYRIITDRGVITRLEASVRWWVEDGWWRRLGPVRMGWEDVRADGYGVSWRVWTERPTEAQREEADWE